MKKWVVIFLTVFMIYSPDAGCGNDNNPGKSIILDVDTSGDDLMAILFLLSQPDIDIKAITVVNGVSTVDAGTEMILRLLSFTGHTQIPVAKGGRFPLEGNNSFPAKWQPSIDKPYGLELPPHSLHASEIPASEMIRNIVKDYRGNITILALGPMTNIARAFADDTALIHSVKEIYISDGAVFVKGAINLEYPAVNNTVSGWNLWVDPLAADEVFCSGARIRLIPLDLTALHGPHPLLLKSGVAGQFRDRVQGVPGRSLATLMNNWIDYYHADTGIGNSEDQAPVWDLVTAVIFTDPSVCMESQDHYLRIRTGDQETAGQIIISDEKASNVNVCLEGNQDLFDRVLLSTAIPGR